MESRMINILLLLSISSVVIGKGLKPIYAIKYDVENVEDINKAVTQGANGLYSFLMCDYHGTPKLVGGSISGDPVDVYMEGLRKKIDPKSKNYNESLVLQIFEIDFFALDDEKRKHVAKKLRDLMLKHQVLKKDTAHFSIVFILPEPSDANLMKFLLESPYAGDSYQKNRIGAGFMGGDAEENKDSLKKFVPNGYLWHFELTSRLMLSREMYEKALKLREKGELSKVVGGILSRDSTLQKLLTYNLDGIVTTDPASLVRLIGKAENKDKYRLAKRTDDPTKTF